MAHVRLEVTFSFGIRDSFTRDIFVTPKTTDAINFMLTCFLNVAKESVNKALCINFSEFLSFTK